MAKFELIGNKFIQDTKYENLDASPEKLQEKFPNYLSVIHDSEKLIPLPDPSSFVPQKDNLQEVIVNRRSLRRYDTDAYLSFSEFGNLLWLTQGVVHVSEKKGLTTRNVASAGSRHPFETYLLVQRVNGLESGVYHYIAQEHALEPFKLGDELLKAGFFSTFDQKQVITSAVTFMWVAQVYRTSWRYGSRAYRYIYLDAGHVCQNLYLASESIDYGVCAIAAFDDDLANQVLDLDGKEQFVIYMASVGKKIKSV